MNSILEFFRLKGLDVSFTIRPYDPDDPSFPTAADVLVVFDEPPVCEHNEGLTWNVRVTFRRVQS